MTAACHDGDRPGRMALTVDLVAGQTLSSFVSALAARNGLRSAPRFCLAFDLDARGIQAGRPEAITELARVAGVSFDRLLAAAVRRGPDPMLAGQRVDGTDLSVPKRACPQCLADDHARQPDLRFETAARYRAAWRHTLVQACPRHDLQLVDVPIGHDDTVQVDDFALLLRHADVAANPLPRNALIATPAEVYIGARLSGETTGVPVLDAMALNDGLLLCEYLGAPHREGHQAPLPLNTSERLDRVNNGLAVVKLGDDAVHRRLDEIAVTVNPHGAAEIGLRSVFKTLYDRIRNKTGDNMLPLRQMLVEIGTKRCLIAFEDTHALGLPVPARDRQTIESATRRFGISDRELRAALIALKAIPSDHAGSPGNSLLFEVGPIADTLSKINNSLNMAAAASLLGVHGQQLVRMCDAGLIEPFFTRPSGDLKPLRYFQRQDVEQFLALLTANCAFVRQPGPFLDIWEAGLKTCRQPVEIIAAIYSGKIQRTYRTRRSPTIRDILVDIGDVRAGVVEADDDLVSAEDCARILTVNIGAMRKIMQAGLLRAETGINPVNQRRQLAARREAVEAFDQEFISLNALRLRFNSSNAGIARILAAMRLRPAFPTYQSEVSLYRRADIAARGDAIERARTENAARLQRRR